MQIQFPKPTVTNMDQLQLLLVVPDLASLVVPARLVLEMVLPQLVVGLQLSELALKVSQKW